MADTDERLRWQLTAATNGAQLQLPAAPRLAHVAVRVHVVGDPDFVNWNAIRRLVDPANEIHLPQEQDTELTCTLS